MSSSLYVPPAVILLLGVMLAGSSVPANADSCVIDTVRHGIKSRECFTNKSMSSEQFNNYCTAGGKALKQSLKDFDYSVGFQNSCPIGWIGYCETRITDKYVYNEAHLANNKKGCSATNPVMPGQWHGR